MKIKSHFTSGQRRFRIIRIYFPFCDSTTKLKHTSSAQLFYAFTFYILPCSNTLIRCGLKFIL